MVRPLKYIVGEADVIAAEGLLNGLEEFREE
jgi:hypothetical protein